MKPFFSKQWNEIILFRSKTPHSATFISCCAFFVLTAVLFFLPDKQKLYVDEKAHYSQIIAIVNGRFKMVDQASMLPGYHFLMAGIALLFKTVNITFFRFISILIGSITIYYSLKLWAHLNGRLNMRNALVFISFPTIAPYFFLMYTDILSLLLFIAALYYGLKKKYQLSVLLGILNLGVRQSTFFWYIFSFVLIFLMHYPVLKLEFLKEYFKKSWLFIIGIILFIAFVIVNKGVAIGQKEMHPGSSIHLGNIFFYLFLIGLFILPFRVKKVRELNYIHYLTIALVFLIYLFNFHSTHPFNLFDTTYFLRNDILRFATSSLYAKFLFFIPICAGILIMFQFYEENRKVFFIYVIFGALSLLPIWLIEQRYYFIPVMLLFLYGIKDDSKTYNSMIFGYMMVSLLLLYVMFNNLYFI